MKGIILAGGNGTRLYPLTATVSKQLLPVYDKPMICYPLGTLMLLGIRDILIISKKSDHEAIRNFLGNGSQLGISISYEIQNKPNGIAEAFILAEDFIENKPVCLILGDNIFHFVSKPVQIKPSENFTGAKIIGYHVSNPENFGVLELDQNKNVISLIEKPKTPKSSYAAVGLYFYDNSVVEKSKTLKKSPRGELEITDLNNKYLMEGKLKCDLLSRGSLWADAGTVNSLNLISNYIHSIEKLQNLKISCLEEIAYREGYIEKKDFKKLAKIYSVNTDYRNYLEQILYEQK